MDPTLTDWIQAGATIVTMFAAIGAVIIASKAPKAAAKFADEFRSASTPIEERQRLKIYVFTMLLKGRKQLAHADTLAALNIVDLAFHDDPSVRSAYRLFIEETARPDFERIIARYYALTFAVGRSLGYGDSLTEADMLLGYYPIVLGKMDEAALAEAEEKIARKAQADAQRLLD